MLSRDFDFHLPPELIAQTPAEPRDSARLLRLGCATQTVSHHTFRDLPDLLRPDDLLVFNDTRVLRARLRGAKIRADGSRGARVEALLLREKAVNVWECLLKPSSRLREGTTLEFSRDERVCVRATTLERRDESWTVRFETATNLRELLEELGEVPLPPYIASRASHDSDYQTVYAKHTSSTRCVSDDETDSLESAAAPTAGLHFTAELIDKLKRRGVETCFVTLGIGIGTFRPMKTERVEDHAMHEENYEVSSATAQKINAHRAEGKRVVAVGTTTVRVLESCCDANGNVKTGFGATSIFIRPGHTFRVVDALVTNFHLPQSTLLVMISALAQHGITEVQSSTRSHELPDERLGLATILGAYHEAINEKYRFFSFGDAMLIE